MSSITGTITDAVNNAMNNFTPVTNLDSNKSIVIDAVPPVISNISSHTLYPPGSTITWTTDE